VKKIGEFVSKHKIPILIVTGLIGVYILYRLLSSSGSSNSDAAAQEAAAEQEAALQAAYAAQGSGASTPASTTTTSLTPTVAAVTASPTTSSSGSPSCPAGYQLDPTGTQCVLSSSPSPIATAPTGVVTQPYAPAASSPLGQAATAAASGQVDSFAGSTGGATGVVGNIVSQWSAIFSPTNPFEINNPSMGANAAQTIDAATAEFCSNNPTDPSCNAANLALASAQATKDQTLATTYSADDGTETSINNPSPTTNGTGSTGTSNPITGGQRIASFLSGGGNLTPNIPPTGTTSPQPVTIQTPQYLTTPTITGYVTGAESEYGSSPIYAPPASARGLTPNLPVLGATGSKTLVPDNSALLASVGPHATDISGGSF
jgi:hypothetical protein